MLTKIFKERLKEWYNYEVESDFIADVEKSKIKMLMDEGFLDSILNVKKFNDWFNSPKDKDIYAHPGIFLRLDKLSKYHFDEYIKKTTFGYFSCDDFGYKKILKFEEKVRKDWIKKINET